MTLRYARPHSSGEFDDLSQARSPLRRRQEYYFAIHIMGEGGCVRSLRLLNKMDNVSDQLKVDSLKFICSACDRVQTSSDFTFYPSGERLLGRCIKLSDEEFQALPIWSYSLPVRVALKSYCDTRGQHDADDHTREVKPVAIIGALKNCFRYDVGRYDYQSGGSTDQRFGDTIFPVELHAHNHRLLRSQTQVAAGVS